MKLRCFLSETSNPYPRPVPDRGASWGDTMSFHIAGRRTVRAVLLAAGSSLVFASSVWAGDAPQAVGAQDSAIPQAGPEAASVDDIVVTGSTIQNRAEIRARQRSTAIVDTLSRDDIGALPDVTIAESLRRITGVTTIYNDDIGQFASIRGLHPDFIPVTLNNLTIATTGDLGEGTRKVNLQVIPGEAVSQIQAFKTLSPDLDAGALGGLINLVPVSAFDYSDPTLIATAGTSYTTYMDVPDINSRGDGKDSPYGGAANVLASTRFGANDQFGLTATGMWQRRPRTQTNLATVGRLYFNAAGVATTPESADWTGLAVPSQFTVHNYTNLFEKSGGTLRLEYRPNDRFYASLFGFAYVSDEQETRNTNHIFSFDQPQNITELTGSIRVKSADSQWRYNTFERDQRGIQWQAVQQIGDRGELSANIGWSHARFLSDRPFVSYLYKPNTRATYDLANVEHPVTMANPDAYLNPANYLLSTTYRDFRGTKSDVWDGRIDYAFNNKTGDRGFGFAVGADYRDLDLARDILSTNYVAGGSSMASNYLTPDFDIPGYFTRALWIDADKFWSTTVNAVPVSASASDSASRISDYGYKEQISSAYVTGSYVTDRLNLSGGLRIDHVSFDATMAQVIGGVIQPQPTTKSNEDTHVLPYLNAVVSLTPAFRIKAAASQTLGRPNPETIATVETIDPTELTITRGNPDIQPRRSTNLDLGVEYYFNEGQGLVTFTGFYKDIKDDILTISSRQTIDGNIYTVSEPINGEGTTYQGLELGFINNSFGGLHPWLQNVGASVNAMWIKGKTSYLYNGVERERDDLLFQADFSANAAVFYGFGDGSEVRLAWNEQGRYVEEIGANPWDDNVSPPFSTVDLTAKWQVTPAWQMRLEGRNILDTDRKRVTGPNLEYERTILEIGGSWFLRLTYKM
jgi:iron complex outermembrane receptor protein